jgi:hypothetical protein
MMGIEIVFNSSYKNLWLFRFIINNKETGNTFTKLVAAVTNTEATNLIKEFINTHHSPEQLQIGSVDHLGSVMIRKER